MKRLSEQGKMASRTTSVRSGSQCDKDPVGDAEDAFLNAISEYGYNSAEALAAQFFFGEIKRRFASRSASLVVS